jgi:hypothetical protein
MRTMMRNDLDPIARPTSHPRETMIKFSFDINSITIIDILPDKTKLSSEYFRENMSRELDLIVYPAGRKPHATRICLHFDDGPVHNMQMVAQAMAECDFRGLDHPAYSLDLAPCDFFLFCYLHKKRIGFLHEMVEDFKEKIRMLIQAIPKSQLIAVSRGG